jgi:hypothetical protein
MAGAFLTTLGACSAQVSELTSSAPTRPSPSEILVAVVPSREGEMPLPPEIANRIQSALVERLAEAHVTAEPFVRGTTHPGAAILQVSVIEANPGNLPERFLIGFGVGKAQMKVRADLLLSDTQSSPSVLAFNTSADSGIKPGLILPGGVALATGRVIGLAVGGGIDVATNIRGGLARPVSQTASAIVSQLKTYYASAGWIWPAQS